MNVLPLSKQIEIVSALTEGCSIRAVERLTGVHRDTIMRLAVRVGQGCLKVHSALMRDLQVNRIELDEIWSYVGKKQKLVTPEDGDRVGDQYTFIAMADTAKAIITFRTGKRTRENTEAFINTLRKRVVGSPEISADGFPAYPWAVSLAFGEQCKFGVIDKHYSVMGTPEASRRYSPGVVVGVSKNAVFGKPSHISTSYVERQNLTLRMQQRRFTRLTNGFSKTYLNHCAAVALYVMHYNFCRVHEALRVTPAMQIGVADHVWTIGELVEAALNQSPKPRHPQFRVIDGGKL
ncbi:MAG: transposase [Alphaproteobacteria bacterium]